MKQIKLITLSNLKKGLGHAISFFIIILFSAMLLNLGLLTWTNYEKNFDKRAEELNSAHGLIAYQNTDSEKISSIEKGFMSDKRISTAEKRSVLFSSGSFVYGTGEQSRNIVILNADEPHEIENFAYITKTDEMVTSPIFLPYLFQTGGGYQLGDAFALTFSSQGGEQTFHFTIAGFYEETFLATINSTVTGFLLEDEEYKKLSNLLNENLKSTLLLAQLDDLSQNEAFTTEYYSSITKYVSPQTLVDNSFYDVLKLARTLTSSIGAMIIVAFSIIITAVSLIVIRFRIGNHIKEEMVNIGTLKSIGYTSRQISASILLQFLSVGLIGCICGVICSYLVLPAISYLFAAQTGIVWNQGFEPVTTLLVLCFTLLLITCTSLFSTRKLKHLHPIIALRNGLSTHNFKKNHVPLDGTPGNLNILLSAKLLIQNFRQNFMIAIIAVAISFTGVFAGVMYYNIVVEKQQFRNLIGGEQTDVDLIVSDPKYADSLLEKIRKMPEVENAIYYQIDAVIHTLDKSELVSYITNEYSSMKNDDILYKGRYPIYENEVALGGFVADKNNLDVGDTITIQKDDLEYTYLISGLTQSSNYLGRDICFTEEGFRLLVPQYHRTNIYIYLIEGTDINSFIDMIKEQEKNTILTAVNRPEVLDSSLGVYNSMIRILSYVLAGITIAIITLTLFMVIKTLLLDKHQNLGIQKAIGFTTGQLIVQTTISIVPVITLFSILGCIIGYIWVNPLISILFSGIGLMKVSFDIPFEMLFGISCIITLYTFFISILISVQIRHITPYSLIRE